MTGLTLSAGETQDLEQAQTSPIIFSSVDTSLTRTLEVDTLLETVISVKL